MSKHSLVLTSADVDRLLQVAREAAKNAYAPFSNFPVGAVLLGSQGEQFLGCNVENSSFGLTICAERNAATSAIAAGCRDWKGIVIVSPSSVPPCGACLQFLSEFSTRLEIWIGSLEPGPKLVGTTLAELLPASMRLDVSYRK